VIGDTTVSLLQRLIDACQGALSPAAAHSILQIQFGEADQARVREHGLKKGRPTMDLPKDLLEHKDGLGVFLNPEEGKEIMTYFTTLTAGLKKKGTGLTDDELGVIGGFFSPDSLSPRFVKRVLAEYGDESVRTAFHIKGDAPAYWLEYLLRRQKGCFYRNRYPSLSMVGSESAA
jgi:hypothetical protein